MRIGGYVKTAGSSYLQYVSRKGLKLGELRPELAAVALRAKIITLANEKNAEPHTEIIQLIRDEATTAAALPYDMTTIRTRANLNFKTFASIMHSLGCDAHRHASLAIHIDQRLLGGRNEIAHGREEYVSLDDWIELRDVVEAVLKDIRVQLANAAATAAYRRS
jgi:acetylornithine deacetylase/succinyl-diaminopimelate desuccinylase-like protein